MGNNWPLWEFIKDRQNCAERIDHEINFIDIWYEMTFKMHLQIVK